MIFLILTLVVKTMNLSEVDKDCRQLQFDLDYDFPTKSDSEDEDNCNDEDQIKKKKELLTSNKTGFEYLKQRVCECFISFWLGYAFASAIGPTITGNFALVSKILFFITSCGLYHYMEFMFKCEYHNWDLSWHDFQIDHSWAYGAAMVMCLVEHFVKYFIL